jgi:hypothetical protein
LYAYLNCQLAIVLVHNCLKLPLHQTQERGEGGGGEEGGEEGREEGRGGGMGGHTLHKGVGRLVTHYQPLNITILDSAFRGQGGPV